MGSQSPLRTRTNDFPDLRQGFDTIPSTLEENMELGREGNILTTACDFLHVKKDIALF